MSDAKPWSGWRRLWFVLSILFAVPAYAIAYSTYGWASFTVTLSPSENDAPNRDTIFWERAFQHPSAEHCLQRTMKADSYFGGGFTVTCDNKADHAFGRSILWAALPAFLMWMLGSVARWVYRGFRPSKPE